MIWQVSPGPDLFCRTVVALTRGITDRGAGARYTRILPQLHGARATPSREQFWLHPRSGPRVHRTRSAGLSRVHRTCPIYFLGPSSFRRCAFEALKRAKNLCSVRGPCDRDFRSLRARDAPSREQFGQQSVFYLCVLGSRPAAASSRSVVSHGDGGRVCATPAHFP